MKVGIAVLVCLLLALQYKFWVEKGSVIDLVRQNKAVSAQIIKNQQQVETNKVMLAEIESLKQGHGAIEERARNELGMIKKGEVFYQFVPYRADTKVEPQS